MILGFEACFLIKLASDQQSEAALLTRQRRAALEGQFVIMQSFRETLVLLQQQAAIPGKKNW